MRKSNFKTFSGLFVFFLLLGCNKYEGDGQLIDHGPLNLSNRYTLGLGDISLGEDNHYNYSISNLPEGQYVFGLLVNSEYVIREPLPINARLKFVVKDSNHNILISEHALIRNWIWNISVESTRTFVYRREGTGTYLKVLRNMSYTIDLKITDTDGSGSVYPAMLIGQMGAGNRPSD